MLSTTQTKTAIARKFDGFLKNTFGITKEINVNNVNKII